RFLIGLLAILVRWLHARDPALVLSECLVQALVGRGIAGQVVRRVDVELGPLPHQDLRHRRDDHPDQRGEGDRRNRRDLIMVIGRGVSVGWVQLSTTTSAISNRVRPDEWRLAWPRDPWADPQATTFNPSSWAFRAMSMLTLLIPEWEKIHIVSRGSNV